MVLGIDASNIRAGGGLTHLIELLRFAKPQQSGIERVLLWAGSHTVDSLDDSPWLEKVRLPILDQGTLQRTFWQRFQLSEVARRVKCDLLFVPGGSHAGSFRPVVTMNRNLLPFEMKEILRFGWSLTALRLLVLRSTQTRSMRRADGVIFLTEYARNRVVRAIGGLKAHTSVIPHGLNSRFRRAPRVQRPISDYSAANPYCLLYVSIVNHYKHQWNVVEAVERLRRAGFPLRIDLVGPAYPSALRKLQEVMGRVDPTGSWARYHGPVPNSELGLIYDQADLAAFASSCETFGQILTEKMAAGLPIACSNRSAMPELLGEAGIYFDPEQPDDIACALRQLIESPELRANKAQASFLAAQRFSWERCSTETFRYLANTLARIER